MENTNSNNGKKQRENKFYTDYNIFPGKVRLVSEDGTSSVVERDDAIQKAKDQGKNLVQIGYNKTEFPHSICKIIDYGKFLYDQNKKQKQAKKTERMNRVELKEIFFSIRIDDNDRKIKTKHAKEFLESGDKVKLIVKLMRREMNRSQLGIDILKTVVNDLSDVGVLDVPISKSENIISCIMRKN